MSALDEAIEARSCGLPEQRRAIVSLDTFEALKAAWDERGQVVELLCGHLNAADDARDAALAMAAKATHRADGAEDRATAAEREAKALRDYSGEVVDHLARALRALDQPKCRGCLGTGKVGIEVEGCSSDPSDVSPPSRIESADCEDCFGIGLELP